MEILIYSIIIIILVYVLINYLNINKITASGEGFTVLNNDILDYLRYEIDKLVDDENAAYRDLGLLAHNRWTHFEGEDFVKGEMIVIDSQPADECCDLQLLTYLQI